MPHSANYAEKYYKIVTAPPPSPESPASSPESPAPSPESPALGKGPRRPHHLPFALGLGETCYYFRTER
jgi:hypothetical protein